MNQISVNDICCGKVLESLNVNLKDNERYASYYSDTIGKSIFVDFSFLLV